MINNKILFITSRNIINTCGELRLIKNRTQVLFNEWSIETDFIVFSNNQRNKKDKEEIGSNSSMVVCNYSWYNIIEIFRTFFEVRELANKLLSENKYLAIVLSGISVFSYSKYFKKNFPEIKIIADIHGANEELIEFKETSFLKSVFKRLVYRIAMIEQKRNLPFCDSAFVVSKALRSYVVKNFKANNLSFFIIPCSQSRNENNLDQTLSNRVKWRKELKITDDDLLFIYSGGISPWQSIDDAHKIYQILKQRIPQQKMQFLIMSHDSSKLKYLASYDVIIRSFKPDEVRSVLCAGDYAFLLRGDFITNNVAFPNKFFEYVMSGMQIICSPHVHDIEQYVRKYQLGIIVKSLNEKSIDEIVTNIKEKSISETDWSPRLQLTNELSFENTLKPFVAYILNN